MELQAEQGHEKKQKIDGYEQDGEVERIKGRTAQIRGVEYLYTGGNLDDQDPQCLIDDMRFRQGIPQSVEMITAQLWRSAIHVAKRIRNQEQLPKVACDAQCLERRDMELRP